MMKELLRNINIDDYNYNLPEERIAQYPVEERDKSRLLVYRKGEISGDIFRNITDYLSPDTLLVFNNTRVIRARLLFTKASGAGIEIFCLEPLSPADYERSFRSASPVEWKCIIGNLKKWKREILITRFTCRGKPYELAARKLSQEGEAWRINFSWAPADISFGEVIESAGHIPLPPYIKRHDEDEDYKRYQTVYSRIEGSVAAPTAGLHFTEVVLRNILNKGIRCVDITLHVGAGTFQPVRSNDISMHEMHSEHFLISRDTIQTLLENKGRIVAVGTTSVRTLESLYWLGVKISRNPSVTDSGLTTGQWEPYENGEKISVEESIESLLNFMKTRQKEILQASTRIMIVPGYEFRMINGLITNFHQPGSTLLLLVSAWTGSEWRRIYSFALENGFRFLSYGDCSLLFR